jgi:hypothetical protein
MVSNKQNLVGAIQFFDEQINTKQFAHIVRRLMHATVRLHMTDEDKMYSDWINDGSFWLNEFLEKIDPQLEKEPHS